MKRTLRAVMMAAVLVGVGQPALAQGTPWEDRVFVNLSFGVDTGTTTISQNRSFVVYGETGTVQGDAEFGSFPIFDVAFGARVFKNVGVGVAYHTGGTKGDGTLTGTVPHPIFFDRPRNFTVGFNDAERDEHATHLQIGWMAPINEKFDLFIFGGPSFYSVTQEMITGLNFVEDGPPFTSVTVQSNIERLKDNSVGYNLGVDGTWFIKTADSWRLGVGGLLRFTGATAKFNVDGNEIETDAGGVQFAVGARIRF
jgi:hypothetical protein